MGFLTVSCALMAFLCLTNILPTVWLEENEEILSTVEVTVVVGRAAVMPCDTTSATNEDRVYMVLLFKQPDGRPIFRTTLDEPPGDPYDVRGRSVTGALEWSDSNSFASRARFITTVHPSALRVENVQLDDEGTYRCRVDFKNSPTKNYQIVLKVIVPPHKIVLFDEKGNDIGGVIGPLEEGDSVSVLCEIRGGRPQPNLIWKLNETELFNHLIVKNDGRVIMSRILLSPAERSWQNTFLRCQANNTNLMSPHERSARIEMRLKPISVKILKKPGILKANKEILLSCVSHGSYPPAALTWWSDNHLYKKGRVEKYTNETSSVLNLYMTPTANDDGTTFRCRAENPLLGTVLEDSFKMIVQHPPVVTVVLGSTLNPNDIKEGDDVYFECLIKSNPKEHRISWFHNGVAIEAKHASTKLLVRQKVTKKDAGLYSCHAVNSEGEATSKAVFLRVQFAIGGTSSELFYTATTDRDYGTLYCHAKNSVGVQEKPCVFHVVKATPPKKPRNCKWARVSHGNVEDDYLSVCCKGSYDRFLPQHYTLETIGKTYRVLLNNTETFPGIYTVRDDGTVTIISVGTNALKVRRDLDFCLNISWAGINIFDDEKIGVTAHNAVGASDTVIIKDFVYVPIVKHKDETSFELSANDIMLLSALLVAAVASTGFSMWFVRRRKLSSASSNKGPSQSMVQVDNQGRRRVVAVPTPTPVGEMATGPDVLNRRTDEPPRVVLESGENNTYDLRILSTNQEGIQSPQLSTDEEEYFGNQSSSVIHVAIHHRPRSSNIQDPSSDDKPEGVREVAV